MGHNLDLGYDKAVGMHLKKLTGEKPVTGGAVT